MLKITMPYEKYLNDKFVAFLKGEGLTNPLVELTTLQVETPLENNVKNYTISLTNSNSTAKRKNEFRLKESEHFCVIGFAVLLGRYAADGSTQEIPQTYPNPALFTTPAERYSLSSVYNGRLQFTTTNLKLSPEFDMFNNYFNAGVASPVTDPAGPIQPVIGAENNERGFVSIVNPILLSGDIAQNVVINLGSGSAANLEPASGENVLIVKPYGFHYMGMTQSQEKGECRVLS